MYLRHILVPLKSLRKKYSVFNVSPGKNSLAVHWKIRKSRKFQMTDKIWKWQFLTILSLEMGRFWYGGTYFNVQILHKTSQNREYFMSLWPFSVQCSRKNCPSFPISMLKVVKNSCFLLIFQWNVTSRFCEGI